MANGMRNASSIINQLKYQPIKQKELQGAVAQEGYDNKAVSQYDKMLGKQVAGEQSRLHALDEFGSDLAMRKDKLAFNKKIHNRQYKLAKDRQDIVASGMKHKRLFDKIEVGVGAVATGTSLWRARTARIENEKFRNEQRVDQAVLMEMMGLKRGALFGVPQGFDSDTTDMYSYRGEY